MILRQLFWQQVKNDWFPILRGEFDKSYMLNLNAHLIGRERDVNIYPPRDDIFRALALTSYCNTKVVIVGQDPYHQPTQAHGLAFSCLSHVPPSLENIFKVAGIQSNSADLTSWAKQGVLLLNSVLTVEQNKPMSHTNIGWEIFTDSIIRILNDNTSGLVFLLWGRHAQVKNALIGNHHHVLQSSHPSPLSAHRGFLKSDCFNKANTFLKEPIDWRLE